MCYHDKFSLPIICIVAAINIYFLYRYSGIEYSIQTDTDVIIRKLISLEQKIDEYRKE